MMNNSMGMMTGKCRKIKIKNVEAETVRYRKKKMDWPSREHMLIRQETWKKIKKRELWKIKFLLNIGNAKNLVFIENIIKPSHQLKIQISKWKFSFRMKTYPIPRWSAYSIPDKNRILKLIKLKTRQE